MYEKTIMKSESLFDHCYRLLIQGTYNVPTK